MTTMFERFAKMVSEEFGCTVKKTSKNNKTTFESLFEVSMEKIFGCELSCDVSSVSFEYDDEPEKIELKETNFLRNEFKVERYFNFAA